MKCFIDLVSPNSNACEVSLDTYNVSGHKLTKVQFIALKRTFNGRLNDFDFSFFGITDSDLEFLVRLGMIENKKDARGKKTYIISNEELKEQVKTIEHDLQNLTSVNLAKEWCIQNYYEPVIVKSSIYSVFESLNEISNDTIE